MRILLIQPDDKEKRYYGYKNVGSYLQPLGLAYVAAVLEKQGHKVRIIDMTVQNINADKIASIVKDNNVELVGLGIVTIMYPAAQKIAKKIKELSPNIKIILGGPHPSANPKDALKDPVFDFAIFGDGEETAVELIKFLENKKTAKSDLKKIKGIAFRYKDEIILNPPRPFIKDLDSLPYPARHLLPHPKHYHVDPDRSYDEPLGTISASRGCPYRCIFCDHSVFGKTWRGRSAKSMVEEAGFLVKKYGVKEIDFEEDLFNFSNKRVYEFCKLWKQHLPKIKWQCIVKVTNMDEHLIKTMADAGCWLINIGVESGSQKILDFIHKDITVEQVKKVTNLADKHGIKVRGLFMINHPTETHEDLKATLDLTLKNPFHTIIVCITNPYPYTELWDIAAKYGTFKKDLTQMTEFPSKPNFVGKNFTADELIKLQKMFYVKFFFRPKQILKYLKFIFSLKPLPALRLLRYYTRGAITVLKA